MGGTTATVKGTDGNTLLTAGPEPLHNMRYILFS